MKTIIPNLIVSLTSYPKRIFTVSKTLETLFNQTIKPEKIILALAKEQFPNLEKDLPLDLNNYIQKGLIEILWCENIGSYKKLIPALRKYPDKIIVTADDDLLYKKDWLEILYKSYLKNKKHIYCHRAHLITFNKKHQVETYNNWNSCFRHRLTSQKLALTSGSGTLFPPHIFNNEIFNEKIFMKLSPTADDLWFYSMAVLSNKKICNIGKKGQRDLFCTVGTQNERLTTINVDENGNDKQFKAILDYYDVIKKRIYSRKDIKYNIYVILSKISKVLRSIKKK